jgi:ribosomal protein S18 acetylase RimI-like enzyme
MMRWRAMTTTDLPTVTKISTEVHGRYAEPLEVYAERLFLCPAGCFVCEVDGTVRGLLVAHPWTRAAPPPALGAMLHTIPDPADTWYLHDIALLPDTRGLGAGQAAVALVDGLARKAGVPDITLVAVNGADRFWAKQGFDYTDASAGGYGPDTYVMRRSVG